MKRVLFVTVLLSILLPAADVMAVVTIATGTQLVDVGYGLLHAASLSTAGYGLCVIQVDFTQAEEGEVCVWESSIFAVCSVAVQVSELIYRPALRVECGIRRGDVYALAAAVKDATLVQYVFVSPRAFVRAWKVKYTY